MIIDKRIEIETIELHGNYPSNINYHDAYELTEGFIIGYKKNNIPLFVKPEDVTDDMLYTEERVYDRADVVRYLEID